MMVDVDFKKSRKDQAIRRKKAKVAFGISGALILIALLIYMGTELGRRRGHNLPGETIPDQGRQHVTTFDHPPYNSNPPTSGWHFPNVAEWGTYREEIPDEILVHNLEHGGIWISYKPGIPEDMIAKLENFHNKFGRKIIVVPRSKNDTEIALAAWNRLDKFNISEYSEERVERFIKAFRNKGPEFVP